MPPASREPALGEPPAMLARQRQQFIAAEVNRRGAVRVSDLVDLLGVSDMTIRRDLDVLARLGVLDKVHGGATALDRDSTSEPGFAVKAQVGLTAKQAIAAAAARLVRPRTAIAISGGTTTWAFAQLLGEVEELTVVTNSLPVAEVMHAAGRKDQTTVLMGGVRTPSDALVGPVAVQSIRNLHVDMVFMGVHGMDLEAGFTTPNLLEAETNRAMWRAARRFVVLADSSKWGLVGLASIAALREADVLITDAGLPERVRDEVADVVEDLVVVPVNGA